MTNRFKTYCREEYTKEFVAKNRAKFLVTGLRMTKKKADCVKFQPTFPAESYVSYVNYAVPTNFYI